MRHGNPAPQNSHQPHRIEEGNTMKATWNRIIRALRRNAAPVEPIDTTLDAAVDVSTAPAATAPRRLAAPSGRTLACLAIGAAVVAAGAMVYKNPPVQHLEQGELGVRMNQVTGSVTQWRDGSVWVLPGLHSVRVFSLRDQTYRPEQMRQANGGAPLQSVEGLSFGLDLGVRYALDPATVASRSGSLPDNVGAEIVEPAVQGLIYKVFARYTVREIFSTKRAEIQQIIETELRTRLAADGVLLRHVQIGKVDLPAEYRRGMDSLLAEELASEKMRYTLELKDKRVKETELDASADKDRRPCPGRGHEACAALQAAPDRAAPARSRGREGLAHQGRRGRRPGTSHRSQRRGRCAPEAGRGRGLPHGPHRQGQR
jgi:regulator of protease activity HflC (stomatin/prohibitin superfamily)